MNDNLRDALIRARLQPVDVAAALEVTPKTVMRWIAGRVPYPRHRAALADLVDVPEPELWPNVEQRRRSAASGLVAAYPHRWAVPRIVWRHLFESADTEIAILAYSALFLAEDTGIMRILADKADAGAQVRILLGDPDSPAVAERGTDEGIGADVMSAKIHNALVLWRPLLAEAENVELRLHSATLYNSLYRADTQALINAHVYATPAAQAPTWHIRAADDADLLATYLASFERVWTEAKPHTDPG